MKRNVLTLGWPLHIIINYNNIIVCARVCVGAVRSGFLIIKPKSTPHNVVRCDYFILQVILVSLSVNVQFERFGEHPYIQVMCTWLSFSVYSKLLGSIMLSVGKFKFLFQFN